MRSSDMRGVVRLLAAFLALFLSLPAFAADGGAQEQAERQTTQPLNNAPVWRDVRGGENPNQTTQVRGIETNVLVQSQGEIWRQIRNGPLTVYGGWLLVAIVLAILAFFLWKGPIKVHGQLT